MRNNFGIYKIILFATVVIFIALALWQRISLPTFNITNEVIDELYLQIADISSDNIPDVEELFKSAELIIKARVTENRIMAAESVLSEVLVEKVYNGDKSIENNKIFIYEPFIINTVKGNEFGLIVDGYNIMEPNRAYYFFLCFNRQPEGYIYNEIEKKQYFICYKSFGKYPADGKLNLELMNINSTYRHKDIKKLDLITYSDTILEIYNRLYTEIKVKIF